jgi:hypothetical protein
MSIQNIPAKITLGLYAFYATTNILLSGMGIFSSFQGNGTPTTNYLKGITGYTALTTSVLSVFDGKGPKDFYHTPSGNPITSNDLEDIDKPNPDFAGLTPREHATLLYAAFNTPEAPVTNPKNWDRGAPLAGSEPFHNVIKDLAFKENSKFEFLEGKRSPEEGGLGVAVFRDKTSGKIHVFVVGLETDKPERDTLPDLTQVVYGGMQEQTAALESYMINLLRKDPDAEFSITGQSMGTIPAAVVSFRMSQRGENIKTVLVEGRTNQKISYENLLLEDQNAFKGWLDKEVTGVKVAGNAWNTSGIGNENPTFSNETTYVFTENTGEVLQGPPVIDMGILGSTHQASKGPQRLALGEIGMAKVDSSTVPTNLVEAASSRGSSDEWGLLGLGVLAAALTGIKKEL